VAPVDSAGSCEALGGAGSVAASPSGAQGERSAGTSSARRQQLHVWVSGDEYRLLRKAASDTDRTVSSVVRRLIRALRAHGH
jgi:hypothetical protein